MPVSRSELAAEIKAPVLSLFTARPTKAFRCARWRAERGGWRRSRSLWNLYQLLHLLGRQRRRYEFPGHGVRHNLVDPLDAIGGHALLGNELAHPQHDFIR